MGEGCASVNEMLRLTLIRFVGLCKRQTAIPLSTARGYCFSTSHGYEPLRSLRIFIVVCIISLQTDWKFSRTIAGRWKMPFFVGAVIARKQKGPRDKQALYEKLPQQRCDASVCQSLLHNRWEFLRSETPMSWMAENQCRIVWLVVFRMTPRVHFNISNFAVV